MVFIDILIIIYKSSRKYNTISEKNERQWLAKGSVVLYPALLIISK